MLECHRGRFYHRECITDDHCLRVPCVTEVRLKYPEINVVPDLHPSLDTESIYESGTLDMIAHGSDS